jgi:hypothetical protein
MVDLLTVIKNEEEQIRQGGGRKAIESQHKKGRLNARERIAKLIDPGSSFFELSIYAAYEMYEEWGGAPAAGTLTGLGGCPLAADDLVGNIPTEIVVHTLAQKGAETGITPHALESVLALTDEIRTKYAH